MADGSYTLVLGALNEEIQGIESLLQSKGTYQWGQRRILKGEINGEPVLVTKTGVGKVFAAMSTQYLIDQFDLKGVLFTGVAGAVNPDLKVGDGILGERLIQYDLDTTPLNIPLGTVPFTKYRYFDADPVMLEKATGISEFNWKVGCIGTGDRFVTDRYLLPDDLGMDCVDMEGAAVAQVCTVNEIPFLITRWISDTADKDATKSFTIKLEELAKKSVLFVDGYFHG